MTAAWVLICVALSMALAAQALPSTQQPPPAPPVTGRGGPAAQGAEADIPLVARFDTDKNKRLDYTERLAAREYLAANPDLRRAVRPPSITRRGTPGARMTTADVRTYPASVPLYDPDTLRTIFLTFERDDWEQELAAFWHTDVEVPATVTVDGRTYQDVGISFRGNNSFTMVPESLKRSLSLSFDWIHDDQALLGYRTVHLLNSNQDPSFVRSVVYLDVARRYLPALGANYVRVVINGENWGIYPNQQAFTREFLRDRFGNTNGTQWKSPNNSVGGGLSYLGDEIALYRRWYEMKGKNNDDAWRSLIKVTRVLHDTAAADLESALAPVINIDNVLRFLALDITLINGDGYWNDGSDYNLFIDRRGLLHLTPHDANEAFRASARNVTLDPLSGLDDPNKALRSKLLASPALRTQYLRHVGDIAEQWLDWERLGPLIERYQAQIRDEVARDTRKIDTLDAFTSSVHGDGTSPAPPTSIRGFVEGRRAFLLSHPEVVKARSR